MNRLECKKHFSNRDITCTECNDCFFTNCRNQAADLMFSDIYTKIATTTNKQVDTPITEEILLQAMEKIKWFDKKENMQKLLREFLDMNKEIIEKYIKFAIDNWYNEKRYFEVDNLWYVYLWSDTVEEKNHITKIITSKEFIESITMWVFDNNDLLSKYSNYYYWDLTYFIDRDLEENLKNLSNSICKNQAIAIRDGELEEFIINLWILWQENKW